MSELNDAIPRQEFLQRQSRTQALMQAWDLDAIVAVSNYGEREGHVCYLCNHHNTFPNVQSHLGLGHAAFLLPAQGLGTLVSPLGYEAGKVAGIEQARTGFDLVGELVRALVENRLTAGRIGVAGTDVLPLEYYTALCAALPQAVFIPANDLLETQRAIKSPLEIELLRTAAQIADAGLEAAMQAVRPGAAQIDVETAARQAAMQAGADWVARVRVSSGEKIQTLSWPMTTRRELEAGHLVFVDFIGWFANYGFDNSRVTVAGRPSPAQKDFLNRVTEATQAMIDMLKLGAEVEFSPQEASGRRVAPFGHGIGLEICETPWLLAGRRVTLQPGMVVCIEPTVSAAEFGSMAIEDTVLVTGSGVEILNRCPRVFWE